MLVKTTSSRIYDVDNADDTMAMTAIDLSNSTYLSDKTELRNVLQKNIGELKSKYIGLSMVQLRQKKRKRTKIDGNIAMAALT